jgi:hypothetical protein
VQPYEHAVTPQFGFPLRVESHHSHQISARVSDRGASTPPRSKGHKPVDSKDHD